MQRAEEGEEEEDEEQPEAPTFKAQPDGTRWGGVRCTGAPAAPVAPVAH